jgi:hypothetical protein
VMVSKLVMVTSLCVFRWSEARSRRWLQHT